MSVRIYGNTPFHAQKWRDRRDDLRARRLSRHLSRHFGAIGDSFELSGHILGHDVRVTGGRI